MGGNWGDRLMAYIGIAAGLIFLYLVLTNAQGATGLLQTAGSVGTNQIKALQGR